MGNELASRLAALKNKGQAPKAAAPRPSAAQAWADAIANAADRTGRQYFTPGNYILRLDSIEYRDGYKGKTWLAGFEVISSEDTHKREKSIKAKKKVTWCLKLDGDGVKKEVRELRTSELKQWHKIAFMLPDDALGELTYGEYLELYPDDSPEKVPLSTPMQTVFAGLILRAASEDQPLTGAIFSVSFIMYETKSKEEICIPRHWERISDDDLQTQLSTPDDDSDIPF